MLKRKNIIQKRTVLILFLVFILLTAGCGKEQAVYFSSAEENASEESPTEAMKKCEEPDAVAVSTEEKVSDYCVYVCGAVAVPGVYTLPAGSRIYEAIELAGGMLKEAAFDSLNQAEQIQDGQMIRVLTKEEMRERQVQGNIAQSAETATEAGTGRVNLNTATKTQLMTLPGIGEAKADSIIAYREKNGSFSSVEDIKKIEGIKEGVFAKIKDSIVVD